MIEDRIRKIEARLQGTEQIPERAKIELLNLVAELRAEVVALAQTHEDDASSIAGFAEASAHEVTRSAKKPELIEAALTGLRGSVEGFETSHPTLAHTANRIAAILANMGI